MSPDADPLVGYDRLLWDLDGTLCVIGVDWKALKAELRARLEAPPEARSLAEVLEVARAQGQWDACLAWVAEHEVAALERDPQLIPTTVALLARHRARSAILTNNTEPAVRRFFAASGVEPVPFVSRDRAGVSKPDRSYLDLIGEGWLGPRTLLIGDTDVDAALAAEGGVEFLHVDALTA
ncbi:MAG: HAD-IA family hydrolase [Planctomycetota bacterium]